MMQPFITGTLQRLPFCSGVALPVFREAYLTATASVSPTGDPYLDGILSGTKWGVTSLTFSFPTDPSFYSYTTESSTNFKAFTTVQQEAVRDVLQNYSAVCCRTRLLAPPPARAKSNRCP